MAEEGVSGGAASASASSVLASSSSRVPGRVSGSGCVRGTASPGGSVVDASAAATRVGVRLRGEDEAGAEAGDDKPLRGLTRPAVAAHAERGVGQSEPGGEAAEDAERGGVAGGVAEAALGVPVGSAAVEVTPVQVP